MKTLEFNGTQRKFHQWKKGIVMEMKHINTLEEVEYFFNDEWCIAVRLECTPYTLEEEQERMIYGDQDHEDYLLSEEYEDDCRREQWDWLKDA